MKISVIIPTYKPKDYIWDCLNSLVRQTLSEQYFEVIIVLNGCCEPWKSQIEDFIYCNMQGINVNFITTERGGVSNARNIALDVAEGDYITFLDDDDFLSPTALEEMLSLASLDLVVVGYPYAFIDGQKDQIAYGLTNVYDYCINRKSLNLNGRARKFFSGPCMKLIPTKCIGDRRFNTKFANGEDSIFMFLISDRINKIVLTSKEAIYYRRFRSNSAVTKRRGTRERIINNCRSIKEYIRIYCKGGYSLCFFLTRIVAELRGIMVAPINSKKHIIW